MRGDSPSSRSSDPNSEKRSKSKQRGRMLRSLLFVSVLASLLLIGIGTGYVFKVINETERITPGEIGKLLDESSVILDQKGEVVENLHYDGIRKIIKYKDMNPTLINAYIAVEDKTFREHHGFNFIRLMGAVWESVTNGRGLRGTSTITQQLARNLYLSDIKSERSLSRKIKEAYYAIQLENTMTKDQIIEAYLNTIYLGSGSKGVQAAAQAYFSKNASELGVVESAMLAGIPKSPVKYSPFIVVEKKDVKESDYIIDDSSPTLTTIFNESCIARYKTVLKLMHDNGYVSASDYESLKDVDLKTYLNPGKVKTADISSYFSDLLKKEVLQVLMQEKGLSEERATNMLYGGGLRIYSTIDLDAQKKLEAIYASTPFTKEYDKKTQQALMNFQKKNRLQATGVADTQTLAKMKAMELIDLADVTGASIQPGSKGDDVIQLKEALERGGYLFRSNPHMPTILCYKDAANNIVSLSKSKKRTVVNSEILLNSFDSAVRDDNSLIIGKNNYQIDSSGNLILLSDRMFNFYRSYGKDNQINDIVIVLKDFYKYDPSTERTLSGGGDFYSRKVNISEMAIYKGGALKVPYEYKHLDEDRNMIISRDFLSQHPEFFKQDASGNLIVSPDNYSISNTGIIQPQSAMTIIDYHTGYIKAIVGGRNVSGQKIYNRATHPRQPGSCEKPIAVYLPAVAKGYTAATVIDDAPRYQNGQRWPLNWFDNTSTKYLGLITMRYALEWSNNVYPVKLAEKIGPDTSLDYLEKMGVTSIVRDGPTNDRNLAAVALGGMTKGISSLELAGAYGTIANKGVYIKPTTFTKIEDSSGNIIYENVPEQTKVVTAQQAFIVQDMMRTGATHALASAAAIRPGNSGIPIAGKTGTTSDKFDAVFCGFTPYYVGTVWIGNDMSMELSDGSKVAAVLWRDVMKSIHTNLPNKDFETPPGMIRMSVDSISGKLPTALSSRDPRGNTIISEFFVPGTQPTEADDVHVEKKICKVSGKLAGPNCPEDSIVSQVFVQRKEAAAIPPDGTAYATKDAMYNVPSGTCPIHSAAGAGTSSTGVETQTSSDGTKTVLQPATAVLSDGSTLRVPVGSVIYPDGSLHLSDGTVVSGFRKLSPEGQTTGESTTP